MSARMHAAAVIARRQALEVVLSPGLYVAVTAGLLAGYALVASFASAVDASGFNPALNPLTDVAARAIGGGFGPSFLERLFAEGPLPSALFLAFTPALLYLSIGSVARFGAEKTAGAVELLASGPADGTSYILAVFYANALLAAAVLAFLLPFFLLAAALGNFAAGPRFFLSFPLFLLASLGVLAWGMFLAAGLRNAASALALFLGCILALAAVPAGAAAATGSSLEALSSIPASLIRWLSPFSWTARCFRAAGEGSVGGLASSLAGLVALPAALLAAAHFVLLRKGVHP